MSLQGETQPRELSGCRRHSCCLRYAGRGPSPAGRGPAGVSARGDANPSPGKARAALQRSAPLCVCIQRACVPVLHVQICACVHVHVWAHVPICVYTCTCVPVCLHLWCLCTHVSIRVPVYIHDCVRVFSGACVPLRVHMRMPV